ncbi:hypothetical protein PVAP13_5NG367680 [Panicum virgatum]|uniref:Uncharacterized protein n=1 Tax=Panicum virgatum TaxID=38727 RepID=A0A8T0RX19_PANVG|nr:hypothetical protein PVAP13_5NG367680 [Panicum virgatum]
MWQPRDRSTLALSQQAPTPFGPVTARWTRLTPPPLTPSGRIDPPSPPTSFRCILLLPPLLLLRSSPPRPRSTPALLAAAHGAVPAHRARATAKALVSKLQPAEVLVLDAVWSVSYRGRLAADEPVEGKLETRAARARGGVGAARGVAALAPPGSVVDGLGAAVLAECEIRGKAASMVVTWPAGARPAKFAVMRRVAAELGVDTNKIATRVSGRAELDALYT